MHQEEETDNLSIYRCMFEGDECVEQIKSKSIFMVGESRVGKSTLFNYFMGLQLKVVKDERTKRAKFICEHSERAVVGSGFKSVTLLPNISSKILLNGVQEDISLQDMAGYKDAGRNYVGVYGVSYMLKVCLQKAKQAKFILVVEHNKM